MSKIFDEFNLTERYIFRYINGPAHDSKGPPTQWKLCITATDEQYLAELLFEISKREDCYFVKYSPDGSPKCRDGMFLGRVFLTTEEETGKLWKELRTDKKLMCNIQDDDAISKYR